MASGPRTALRGNACMLICSLGSFPRLEMASIQFVVQGGSIAICAYSTHANVHTHATRELSYAMFLFYSFYSLTRPCCFTCTHEGSVNASFGAEDSLQLSCTAYLCGVPCYIYVDSSKPLRPPAAWHAAGVSPGSLAARQICHIHVQGLSV